MRDLEWYSPEFAEAESLMLDHIEAGLAAVERD